MNVRDKGNKWLLGLLACAALLGEGAAHAELVLYDKDGWTVKHDGRAQGFYQLGFGDTNPSGGTGPVYYDFDFLDTAAGDADNHFLSSRFRSGWTGGRFNWRVTKQMTSDTKVSAYLGIAYGISTQDAPPKTNNAWDVRNGFLEVEAPWGDLVIGRSVGLYTLGSIISTINMTSAAVGLGNACSIGGDGLGCYTTGYGSRFPGFWAGFFYTTPDMGGLKIKLAAMDPVKVGADLTPPGAMIPVSQQFPKTPLPHFQTLIMYDAAVNETVHLKPFFNGFWQRVGRTDAMTGVSRNLDPMGGGAGLDLHLGDFKVGAGGTFEHGTALYVPLFGAEPIDGTGALRDGSSYYVHGMVKLGQVDIGAGFGQANLKRSTFDEANNLNINKNQRNIYGSLQYHIGPITAVAELNLLHHEWYYGNTQNVQVVAVGADFAY